MRTGTATQVTDADTTHPADHADHADPAHETHPAPAPAARRQSTQRAPHPS
ncbi:MULTISPECIES: hypothetical protein [Streptomyces]|uniref:hypothetical protein n=1 Tax=Streptomyces TaxID=1883 RepID=UPI00143D8420|nr:hypothetical protein [Streptomyces lasalocidi]